MNVRTLYFVRHGQTEWNAAQRMQGQGDSPLTPLGRRQADRSGKFLATRQIDAIFASPLGRVRETLAAIGKHLDLSVTFDNRLQEWHCGDWSGHLHADLAKKWPDEFAAWQRDRFGYRPPNAENFPDLMVRGGKAITEICDAGHKTTAIVSHGLIGRAIIAGLLDLDPGITMQVRQANDVIIRLRGEGGTWKADHFTGGQGPLPGLPSINVHPRPDIA